MNLLRIFRSAPPSIEDSARQLGSIAHLNARERYKAKARLMRQEMGLDPLEALR